MYIHVLHVFIYLYVHHDGTYTFMNVKSMYGHSTDTSVQLHYHTSLSIRPDQPCDTCESQLRAGSSPSEQPPSCHQSSQVTDHTGVACSWVKLPARNKGISGTQPIMSKQLVKTCMYIAYTCTYSVYTCTYIVHGYPGVYAYTTAAYTTPFPSHY
jgi:hypothetical protein